MSFGQEIVRSFREAAEAVCKPPKAVLRSFFLTAPLPDETPERIGRLVNRLKSSPDWKETFEFLQNNDIHVIFTRDVSAAAFQSRSNAKDGKYQTIPGSGVIGLNPDMPDNILSSALFHEIRHARQQMEGLRMPAKQISPFEVAWFNRIIEADAEADNVLKLLRMKLAGDGQLFEVNKVFSPNMNRVAEEQYKKDPTSLEDGRLRRMVFDTWFCESKNNKQSFYDAEAISSLWPHFRGRLEKFSDHGFPKTPLTATDLEKLGTIGGEKLNYLTVPGFKPLDDPYYKAGFSPIHQQKLQQLTDDWQKTFQPAPKQAPAIRLGR